MQSRTHAIATGIFVLGLAMAGWAGGTTSTSTRHPPLTDAASSPQELVDRFLHALEAKDPDGLHRLRVTESEFRDVILPGFVPAGEQPRTYPDSYTDFAWQTLDTKSHYYERYLLAQYGGRHYTVKDTKYAEGTGEYATYRTLKQLRLVLDADGTEVRLGTGSIVAMGGQYKFASFVYDD